MVEKTDYIKRFKALHKEKTGKTLSDKEALEYFEKLIALVQTVYQPIQKQTNEQDYSAGLRS